MRQSVEKFEMSKQTNKTSELVMTSERFRAWRKHLGLKQKEAAERLGVRDAVQFDALLAGWEADRVLIFADETAAEINPLEALKTCRGKPLGLLIGGVNFSDLAVTLKEAVMAADGTVAAPAVMLKYGAFLQTVFDFTIVAFAIFMVIKAMNSMQKKAEEAPAAPPEPSKEEKLLTEIRDLLKERG